VSKFGKYFCYLLLVTGIPDGSTPPRYPDANLWLDAAQRKNLGFKSVQPIPDQNEYENGNNYAVVGDRHSPIAYASSTLVNGETHVSPEWEFCIFCKRIIFLLFFFVIKA